MWLPNSVVHWYCVDVLDSVMKVAVDWSILVTSSVWAWFLRSNKPVRKCWIWLISVVTAGVERRKFQRSNQAQSDEDYGEDFDDFFSVADACSKQLRRCLICLFWSESVCKHTMFTGFSMFNNGVSYKFALRGHRFHKVVTILTKKKCFASVLTAADSST